MKKQIRLFEVLEKGAQQIDNSLLERIIDANAVFADLELNNNILKQLVSDYAKLERENYHLLCKLENQNRTIQEDLIAAGEIQRSLLPEKRIDLPGYKITWDCIQCDQIGGDLINIFPYDDNHSVFYIIDVSGHGPKAAMITVALSQFLLPYGPSARNRDFLAPASIFAELELEFPFERFNSFFTIIYGVLNHKTGKCRICNSAHPYPIINNDSSSNFIEETNPMIGLKLASDWEETELNLAANQKLLLYTDGAFECTNPNNEAFGENRLIKTFSELCAQNRSEILEKLHDQVASFCNGKTFADDYSLLLIERQK
jgi:sigma-B regulation protein RsbU (phosphoserine phosphatase)